MDYEDMSQAEKDAFRLRLHTEELLEVAKELRARLTVIAVLLLGIGLKLWIG